MNTSERVVNAGGSPAIVHIVDFDERFRAVQRLMRQWHLDVDRERLAKLTCCIVIGDDETDDELTTPLTTKEVELLDALARQKRQSELVFLAAAETLCMMGRE